MSKTNGAPMNAKMAETLSLIQRGQYSTGHLGTLKALRDRGLVTFTVRTHRRRFGRTVESLTVSVSLTDAGRAA